MDDFESDNGYEGGSTLSKINSAHIVNVTLNELWKDYFRHYKARKYQDANMDLDCIWTVLGGEKGVKGSTIDKEYFDMEMKIAQTGKIYNGEGKKLLSDEPPKEYYITIRKQMLYLQEKALFLRRLQNEQGKGSAYHDADEDYMDG